MANSIDFAKNYTDIIDEVYQHAGVSGVLNSGRRMVRAGHNAKEVMIPKISVTGLGDYTRNVGYKTGSITYEFETKTFNYDQGIRLFADVMDVEEAGVLDRFVEWPCLHSLLLAVVWGRVPARYGASCSRCCPFALRNSVSARRPADCSPWASLLSTPRCLATRSTGAFSCRRSRCLGR